MVRLRQETERARSDLMTFRDSVYARQRKPRGKPREVRSLDWEEARGLLSPGDAFLEYLVGDYVTVIYAGVHPEGGEPKLTVKYIDNEDAQLQNRLRRLIVAATDPRGQMESRAGQLWGLLVEPVRAAIPGPEGRVRQVSAGGLRDHLRLQCHCMG
jgi:hypothetical protein